MRSWIDAFNSFTTFGILAAIAFGILLLLARKEKQSKS